MKKAFTLIEMIFVIVILSIVGMISFSQIAVVYESLLQKEAHNELENEAKIIVEQIAARLDNGIKESFVALLDNTATNCMPISILSNSNKVLAWVGIDTEGRNGIWDATLSYYKPGWSGFADLASSTRGASEANISTPGSNLTNADQIIQDLGGAGLVGSAVYFADSADSNSCSAFYFAAGGTKYIFPIQQKIDDTNFRISGAIGSIKEQYQLSWSAYAVEYNASGNDTNLTLYYDFQPWNTAQNTPATAGGKTVLGQNVSAFGFKYENGLVRINVCIKRPVNGLEFEICKERAIF